MTVYMTGDEMVFRGDIEEPFREMVEHFTPEKAYRIRIQGRHILALDDCGEEWGFATDPDDSYYYARFFYTKGEIRDMKLGRIGI